MSRTEARMSKRVLVVDDEPSIRVMISKVLSKMDLDVRVADSGESALDIIRGEEPFDLCLVDFRLSGMDGVALTREVKEASPATKVVMMTGSAEENTPDEALSAGVECIIYKPFEISLLRMVVNRSLFDEAPVASIGGAVVGSQGTLGNRRQCGRKPCHEYVSFTVADFEEQGPGTAVDFQGLALNVSDSGMCLRADFPIDRGNTLYLQDGAEQKAAQVQWSIPLGENEYRMGLRFL
jgi:CheY-like chemotaxis protein